MLRFSLSIDFFVDSLSTHLLLNSWVKIAHVYLSSREVESMPKKMERWNVPVPRPLNSALERILLRNAHASKAAFIRDAVRKELSKYGVTEKDLLEPEEE